MRKTLLPTFVCIVMILAARAQAADLPVEPPPPPGPPTLYDWSGFYVGVHAGGAWNTKGSDISSTIDGEIGSLSVASSGFMGGGQVGFSLAICPSWLVGIEADVSGAQFESNATFSTATTAEIQGDSEIDEFGTVRARVGYVSNTLLIYGTGGFAWAGEQLSRVQTVGMTGNAGIGTLETAWQVGTGWVAGLGAEWAFAPRWTARVEYLHLDVSGASFLFPVAEVRYNVRSTIDIARFGLNYMLNFSDPVLARY
jgi:outer membrane immunogenic protein